MATRMQQRRGTAAQWTSANPVLGAGEIGFETDTGKFKIGDGTNQWGALSYFLDSTDAQGALQGYVLTEDVGIANGVASLDATGNVPVSQLGNIIDGAPEVLNTLNELAAALGDDADFLTTLAPKANPTFTGTVSAPTPDGTSNTTVVATTAFVQTAKLAALSYTDSEISDLNTEIRSHIDSSISTAVSAAVSASATDLTNQIDGVEQSINTRIDGLDSSIDTRIDGLDSSITSINTRIDGVETTAAQAVVDHAADTTNVHGIADTSVLANQSQVSAAQTNAQTYADGILSTHTADTTNVHGIVDTAQLAYLNAASQTFTGNMEVDGNVVVDGNLTVNGTTFNASSTSITIEDNLVQLAHQNAGNTVDLGIVVGYNDGSAKHAGLVKDVSDSGIWKLFKGVTTEPTTTVNFTQGSLDDLAVAGLTATSVTATTATIGGVAFTEKADKTATINTMSGNHTAVLADVNNIREMSNGGTFTIPADNAFWPVGQRVEIVQTGSSQVTIAGASGVTVNGTPGLKLRAQWSGATIIKRAANVFVVLGDLAA